MMKTALYTLIAREKTADILRTLSASIGLPVRLADADGAVLEAYGAAPGFCGLTCGGCQPGRAKGHGPADGRAPYPGAVRILACNAGTACVAYPILFRGTPAGTVLIGPFLMEAHGSALGSRGGDAQSPPSARPPGLSFGVSGMPFLTPERAAHIGRLAGHLLAPLLPAGPGAAREDGVKGNRQPRISQSIRMLAAEEAQDADGYPFDKEKVLLVQVKTGNAPAARGALNDLLAYVLLHRDGHLAAMRNRALELATLLTRVAVEGGAATDGVFRLGSRFIASLQGINSVDALCFQLQEIAGVFMETMFPLEKQTGGAAVRRAMRYIALHYPEPLSLEQVAGQASLSPAYFSSLFRKAAGTGFAEYLNLVRIEEGKRLLASTDRAIVDIAVAVGYADQSYFSRVFKKYTGLSPRLYR